jgi:hypothetical protein
LQRVGVHKNEQSLIHVPVESDSARTTSGAPLRRASTIHHVAVSRNDRSSRSRQIATYFKRMLQECNDDVPPDRTTGPMHSTANVGSARL